MKVLGVILVAMTATFVGALVTQDIQKRLNRWLSPRLKSFDQLRSRWNKRPSLGAGAGLVRNIQITNQKSLRKREK
jgi:hypothetical protein